MWTISFARSICAAKNPTYMVYDEANTYNNLEDHFWRINLKEYAESGSKISLPGILFEIDLLPMKLSPSKRCFRFSRG